MNESMFFGSAVYLIQFSSFLMTNMKWLRILALAAGAGKISYRLIFAFDATSLFWECAFFVANLCNLCIILLDQRPVNLKPDEQFFLSTVAPELSRGDARCLARIGDWVELPTGSNITTEGMLVEKLTFLAGGRVDILRSGIRIGQCVAGDFVGEMTFATGKPATATAKAAEPCRALCFTKAKLDAVQRARPLIKITLQAGINRNLVEKLVAMSADPDSGLEPLTDRLEQT